MKSLSFKKCRMDNQIYISQFTLILLVERLFKWFWVLFCYFILQLAKLGSKMKCIFLLFEIQYFRSSFVSKNPSFLFCPRLKQLLFSGRYSKNPKIFWRLWTSIFQYANLKMVPLIASELFNRNLSIIYPTLF